MSPSHELVEKAAGQPQPWLSLALGHGRLEVVTFPCKNARVSFLPLLTRPWTRTRRRMEHPLPWLFPCRILGQQIKPHLLSEAHVPAQLLRTRFGVTFPCSRAVTVCGGGTADMGRSG